MARATKTGSSRRKGDEYQDLTALQLVLESYIDHASFQVFIEYEKAGSLDDVVLLLPGEIHAYQVKHAVSPTAVYGVKDITDANSVVFIEKFAKSWSSLVSQFSDRKLYIYLRSNRALDADLASLVDDSGYFDEKFRENRYRSDKRKLRKSIFEASGLCESEFQEFLGCFRFDLRQPSWLQLENLIGAELLDHKLGISDRRVFSELKREVERHAIEIADPITPATVDSFLRETQSRYLLSQSFPVNEEHFIQPTNLREQLNVKLAEADGEYVVVTGPPGSGKSTSLTQYCDNLESSRSDKFTVVRYYCFIRVNDNRQRLRLEAKSLRVNLLNQLERRFPSVLNDRRFDFGEERFLESFERVAEHCKSEGQKLVVLLDGLDHVERDDELRDSVISALPADVPKNVVVLIGTQELSRWAPIALKSAREDRHIPMPLFSFNEVRAYIVDKCGIEADAETLGKVFEKSSGLPLHLRYLAETLSTAESVKDAIENIPAAIGGDVRTYYETLWAAFDLEQREDARYLSVVLASLRFSVHEDELQAFQTGVGDTPRFSAAYRRVRHLLLRKNSLISVFHNSFRTFVLGKTSESTQAEIAGGILAKLKQEELESARWFRHALNYGIEAGCYEYVLTCVNREFVDNALVRFRPEDEIRSGIENAISAAEASEDIVALARLGTLKYRTHERLEYTFDWFSLSEILLYTGRVGQVVDPIYCNDTKRLTGGDAYSLAVILKLVELDNGDLAQKLFDAFIKDFHGSNSIDRHDAISLYRCTGLFKTRPSRVLRSIANNPMQREFREREELTAIHAPHLAAYLEGLVQSGQDRVWRRLKKLQTPFPNSLYRQLIMRAIGKLRNNDELKSEIQEYILEHPEETSLEVAFLAAKAALSPETVNRLAGSFEFPSDGLPSSSLSSELDSYAKKFAYWAVIIGNTSTDDVARQIELRMANKKTLWSCMHLHLLYVGAAFGGHFANRQIEWEEIEKAISVLLNADDNPSERKFELLPALKSVLDISLGWLGQVVAEACPERVDDWIKLLLKLRSSYIWTTHYGIGEVTVDYSFEFSIWKKQASFSEIRACLLPVLRNCARTYGDALSLKGGERGNHYLALASLAARCGFEGYVDKWLLLGIQTSLAYGYRKDVTLEKLTDLLEIVQQAFPHKVLSGAAAVLEMNCWIPHATDGRCTKHFAQYILPLIQKQNRAAALGILPIYYEEFARWQASESVIKYVLVRDSGDPEFLWALASLLKPNESLPVRSHVVSKLSNGNGDWMNRLDHFIETMVNPRHWPDENWQKSIQEHERPKRRQRHEGSAYNRGENDCSFEGQNVSEANLLEMCRSSFEDLEQVFERLKDENDHFSEYKFLELLPSHIQVSQGTAELDSISEFVKKHAQYTTSIYWSEIGSRYLRLGDRSKGLVCLERAIENSPTSKALQTLNECDPVRAKSIFTKYIAEKLKGAAHHGFNAAYVCGRACRVFGDTEQLENIYEDYLNHCEELFSQWPDEKRFDTLRSWGDKDPDEELQILQLLFGQMFAPTYEFGNRLVSSIAELVENRCDKVLPVFVAHLSTAEGLKFRRLIQILFRVAAVEPKVLHRLDGNLGNFSREDDLFLNLSLRNLGGIAFKATKEMPSQLAIAVAKIERRYSSAFVYRGFNILTTEPSGEFRELIKNGAAVSFRRELEGICEVLELDSGSILAQLERKFLKTGASLQEEKKKSISTYRAYSHPQGWPVIWFVSSFQMEISAILYKTIDEVLQKRGYQTGHVEAIWRIIQPNDPEYSDNKLSKKPDDIVPLFVEDKNKWIEDGEREEKVVFNKSFASDWIVAFEFQHVAQDSPYHREFVRQTRTTSALVSPEFCHSISGFPATCWQEFVVTHHLAENLTSPQFRDAIVNGHLAEPENSPCLPFVATKEKHAGFLGYHSLCSFASRIVRDFRLAFDGHSVFDKGNRVAFFEAWQEGHSDEDYNDEPLSYGVRFQVCSDFIKKVQGDTGFAFATRTIENRFALDDYSPEPEMRSSNCQISVWPLSNKGNADLPASD